MPRGRRKLEVTPEQAAAMAGPAAEATLNTLSGETVHVDVEMDRNEKEDLEEYCRHHPETKTPGEALKKMAGLRGYRAMKQMTNPERKKPSMDIRDVGIPQNIPCALVQTLKKMGMSYGEYLEASSKLALELAQKAAGGDERARKALRAMFVNIASES